MAQRNIAVKVSLEAKSYLDGLSRLEQETRKVTASTKELTAEQQKAADDKAAQAAFKRRVDAYKEVGKAALLTSAALTTAFVASAKASADFEQQMSQVQYVSKASTAQMTALRGAAFSTGKAFGLSASQVASAQLELAKAGVSAKDIIGGALPGALALASAGQIDVAKATSIASTAMTQFGKSGKDVPHIADLLAASADRSVASVDSVGDALNQSGLVAAQFGLSIEDTVGTLTAFSKAGLNGSDAGTSFKTMLLSLASPSKQAQAELDKYNITAYDSQGAFVGITSLAEQLQKNFKGVSQANRDAALSTIFGTDAIRAANVLYKQGADVTQGFAKSQNVAGAAMQAAEAKLDNLNGDLQKLGAAFQNDLIGAGSNAQGALRGVTQAATGVLDVFGSLPGPVQGTGLAITGVGAAAAATGGAFLIMAPKIVAAKAVLSDMGVTNLSLKGGLKGTAAFLTGPWAAAFALGTTAMIGFEARQASLLAASSGTTNALITQTQAQKIYAQAQQDAAKSSNFIYDALTASSKAFGAADASISATTQQYKTLQGALQGLQTPDFGAFLSQFAPGNAAALGPWKDAFTKLDASLSDVNVSATQAATGFTNLAAPLNGNKTAMAQLLDQFPKYKQALIDQATAQGLNVTSGTAAQQSAKLLGLVQENAATAAKDHASALQVLAGGADAGRASVQSLSDAIKNLDGGQLNARDAARGFEQAIDDATAAAKKNGRTLDINTQAGRDNQAALDNIARAAQSSAQALLDSNASHSKVAKTVRDGRKAYIDAAVAMGTERKDAIKLANSIFQIPTSRKTLITVDGTGKAITAAEALQHKLNTLTDGVYTVNVNFAQTGSINDSGLIGTGKGPVTRAGGGPITGPGPKGKDSVLIYAAPGEHVLTASEVDKMGGQAGVYAFRQQLHAYANGGAIGDATSAATAAQRSADAYQRKIITVKGYLAKAQKAAAAADRAADKASDASSAIYGKGTGQAKHDAAQRARSLKQKADAAGKLVDKLEKQIDDLRKNRDDQRDKASAATDRAETLRDSREDFVSGQRRATADNPIDPLSYIDQLRSMSRDDNYSSARQATYQKAANQYEQSIVDLTQKSKDAAAQLDVLKDRASQVQDTMAQMRSGIASAISGGYGIAGAKTADSTTDAFTELVQTGFKDLYGVQVATYNQVQHDATTTLGGYTAGGIDAYFANASNATGAFANDLQTLANRGVNGQLLAQIAGYGVEQGAPIAKALLSGTAGQIASINQNYANVQDRADMAGGIVSDVNYGALVKAAQDQVAAAQASADQITAQLQADGEKLRKLIASAFGLTGYAVGTANATPGWHLVGEQGPELANFGRGGGSVLTAPTTRALLAGSGRAQPDTHVHVHVTGDDSVLAQAMTVVADRRIALDSMQDALLRRGGAA